MRPTTTGPTPSRWTPTVRAWTLRPIRTPDRVRWPRHGAARALVILLPCALLAACGATTPKWSADWGGPYAEFDDAERASFTSARALMDEGRATAALEELRALAASDPENFEVACWLQDVESSLLRDGVDVFGGAESRREAPRDDDAAPEDVLQRAYTERATREPSVVSFVLAARAETDVPAALNLLENALELDPNCPWAHYGMSHVLLEDRTRIDRWGLAKDSLARALELDPGNLRARRLEAWMMAEQGTRNTAERLLRRWIGQAEADPRVARSAVVEALLDLSLLMLLRGENRRAERVLEDLEGEPTSRARRWMLLTVARQEGGDVLGALDATLRAQGAAGGAVLPVVQEALLNELFLDRPEVADARWREVAGLVDDTTSIRDLVQGLRARVRMERKAKESEDAPEGR
ncbi:MAG: hypothetical protein AAGB93_20245 [Planctomycetota bacterium]